MRQDERCRIFLCSVIVGMQICIQMGEESVCYIRTIKFRSSAVPLSSDPIRPVPIPPYPVRSLHQHARQLPGIVRIHLHAAQLRHPGRIRQPADQRLLAQLQCGGEGVCGHILLLRV